MNNMWILAQTDAGEESSSISAVPVNEEQTTTTTVAADPNAPATRVPRTKVPFQQHFILIGLMVLVMYFLLFRGPRKKQQQHKQMVQSLEKNDRIRTIGGILGTVVDIKDDEITLKIDESNNTKIKISHSAVGKKITKDKD